MAFTTKRFRLFNREIRISIKKLQKTTAGKTTSLPLPFKMDDNIKRSLTRMQINKELNHNQNRFLKNPYT